MRAEQRGRSLTVAPCILQNHQWRKLLFVLVLGAVSWRERKLTSISQVTDCCFIIFIKIVTREKNKQTPAKNKRVDWLLKDLTTKNYLIFIMEKQWVSYGNDKLTLEITWQCGTVKDIQMKTLFYSIYFNTKSVLMAESCNSQCFSFGNMDFLYSLQNSLMQNSIM